jgi:hypothetical protein
MERQALRKLEKNSRSSLEQRKMLVKSWEDVKEIFEQGDNGCCESEQDEESH